MAFEFNLFHALISPGVCWPARLISKKSVVHIHFLSVGTVQGRLRQLPLMLPAQTAEETSLQRVIQFWTGFLGVSLSADRAVP